MNERILCNSLHPILTTVHTTQYMSPYTIYVLNMHTNYRNTLSYMHTPHSQPSRPLTPYHSTLAHILHSAYRLMPNFGLRILQPDHVRALEAPRTYLACPSACKKAKTTTPRIPMWSPTMVLTKRYSAWLRRSDGMRYFLSPMAVDTSMCKVYLWPGTTIHPYAKRPSPMHATSPHMDSCIHWTRPRCLLYVFLYEERIPRICTEDELCRWEYHHLSHRFGANEYVESVCWETVVKLFHPSPRTDSTQIGT